MKKKIYRVKTGNGVNVFNIHNTAMNRSVWHFDNIRSDVKKLIKANLTECDYDGCLFFWSLEIAFSAFNIELREIKQAYSGQDEVDYPIDEVRECDQVRVYLTAYTFEDGELIGEEDVEISESLIIE